VSFVAAGGTMEKMMPGFHSLVDPVGHRVGQNLQELDKIIKHGKLHLPYEPVYECGYLSVK
jgi:hypothetical protein